MKCNEFSDPKKEKDSLQMASTSFKASGFCLVWF